MPVSHFSVVPVAQLNPSTKRGIAVLTSTKDSEIDAKKAIDGLTGTTRRTVMDRFNHWILGGIKDEYFHGWPNEADNNKCWVFKWKVNRVRHRLYGFLAHPLKKTNPSFMLCVLAYWTTKAAQHTDPAIKTRLNMLRADPMIGAAISAEYQDQEGEK